MSGPNIYEKDISHLEWVDVYQVCLLFEVDDNSGALQHALKKVLFAGRRGTKSKEQDVREARDSLDRWLEIYTDGHS